MPLHTVEKTSTWEQCTCGVHTCLRSLSSSFPESGSLALRRPYTPKSSEDDPFFKILPTEIVVELTLL